MLWEWLRPIDQQVVRKELQPALGGDRGIQHADRSGGGVSGIDENLPAGLLLLPIHGLERFAGHQHFAAYFEGGGQLGFLKKRRVHPEGNGANGSNVGRDILAGRTIAARDAAHQNSVFILQGNAEAIEFVLGYVFNFLAAASLAHPAIEIAQRVVGKCVVEAQHRTRVAHRLKTRARDASHARRGRIRRDQFRIRGLQLFQAVHQAVVSGVRHLGIVQNVVAVVVMANLFPQLFDLVFRRRSLGHGHPLKNIQARRRHAKAAAQLEARICPEPSFGFGWSCTTS